MLVTFKYKNHRGEETVRNVDVKSIDFVLNPGYGYQPGWFLSGICQDKQANRSFALSHIVLVDNKHSYTIPLES